MKQIKYDTYINKLYPAKNINTINYSYITCTKMVLEHQDSYQNYFGNMIQELVKN